MTRKLLFLAIALGLVSTALAGSNGGFAGSFARMGAGARARAMGNAFTGLAEGTSAVYFNPGALPFGKLREVNAATMNMALDRRLDYLAFTSPVHPKPRPGTPPVNAGVGIAWLHAAVSDIDSRDFDGNPLPTINQSSNEFFFGFGIQFHKNFGAGLAAKVIYDTYGKIGTKDRSVNGNGFGLDFGAFAKPMEHLTVGAQIKDVNAKTTWSTTDYWEQGSSKEDKWPLQYRIGAAYQESGFTCALDFESSDRKESCLHAGAELAPEFSDQQGIAFRMGYEGQREGTVSVGMGFWFRLMRAKIALDLAYSLESIAPNNATMLGFGVTF